MRIEEEWVLEKDSEIGKVAVRYNIYWFMRGRLVHMKKCHMNRCLAIMKGKERLPNPVISPTMAQALKARMSWAT